MRERVGVLDLSSFAKLEVSGADAGALLDRLCANRLPRRDGRVMLGHFLTALGGIECEMTLTRLAADRWYCLSGAVAEQHDLDWLNQHIGEGEDVVVHDVTDERGVLVLTGPRSRDVLSQLTTAALDSDELGYELHVPMAELGTVYDATWQAGEAHGLADFGTYALNSLRMEKGYKAWGAELTTEITPVEARLERFVDWGKEFLGKHAVVARRDEGISTELVYLELHADDRDCLGNEPVYDGERIMGVTTSGAFGHAARKSLAFAYVEPKFATPGTRVATVLSAPAWDAENARLRG